MLSDEIREMKDEDLLVELDDAREELMRLRFQLTSGELTDHNLLRFARRKVARILTIMHERGHAAEEGEA